MAKGWSGGGPWLAALLFAWGCAGTDEAGQARPAPAAGPEVHLNDLPVIQRARAHRELGIRAMERAYAASRDITRDSRFREAWVALELASDAYHEALATAPRRYHPVIETEIDAVAGLLRQIQRERDSTPS